MPTLTSAILTQFVSDIFQGAGATESIADLVAKSLVQNDMVGHVSHGVVRVRQYLDSIERGDLNPAATPKLVNDAGGICTVDAQRGFGQVAARWTMSEAIRRAKEHGLAAAGLVNCGHVGRLGEWVQMAADEDAVAVAFCNGGGPRGSVTPFGGAERLLGTNPIAAAVPVGGEAPMVLDFATSAVAEGKVRVARNRGKMIPEGWVLNAEGNATTDPNDLYNGGMLLPAATHKGYALSLLVEFLGGLLTGSGSAMLPNFRGGNGVLFLVLNIPAFRPLEDFLADSRVAAQRVKTVKPAPGFQKVLLPGEPEQRSLAQTQAQGIDVDDTTWQLLTDAAAQYNAQVPSQTT